jgi:hypothetical protein
VRGICLPAGEWNKGGRRETHAIALQKERESLYDVGRFIFCLYSAAFIYDAKSDMLNI